MSHKYLLLVLVAAIIIFPVMAADPYDGYIPDSIAGEEPLNVTFTDVSYNTPTSWQWNMTDVTGANVPITFSTSQNPFYVFSQGNWSITLKTTNAYGSNISLLNTAFVNVTGTSAVIPVTNFTASPQNTTYGQSITFTDTSTGSPTEWRWCYYSTPSTCTDFGSTQNITISTLPVGTWDIELTASNAAGYDTVVKTGYVTVNSGVGAPVASFSPEGVTVPGSAYKYINISYPQTINFNDTSTGTPTSWYWQLEYSVYDSAHGTWDVSEYTATTQNVSYSYNSTSFGARPTLAVTLTAYNAGGNSTSVTKYVYGVEPPVTPIPSFNSLNYNTGAAMAGGSGTTGYQAVYPGNTVQFSDTSTNCGGSYPCSYEWLINAGNGTSYSYYTTPVNFTWTNAPSGNYSVTFSVTNEAGTGTLSLPTFIHFLNQTPVPGPTGITGVAGVDQIQWNWTNPAISNYGFTTVWNGATIIENTTANGSLWVGLDPNKTYMVTLTSTSSEGIYNSTISASGSATTLNASWEYSTPGTYYWVCPAGVYNISTLFVAGGGSGHGGWTSGSTYYAGGGGDAGEMQTVSRIAVIPGTNYTLVLGAGGINGSWNGASHTGGDTTGFGRTFKGGAGGDQLYTEAVGGDGGTGYGTTRYALNGTDSFGYSGGASGLGYGAGGGGGAGWTGPGYSTIGGYGAGGYINITVYSYSTDNTPNFAADMTTGVVGTLIHFTDLSTIINTAGLTYNWSFGDGYYSSTVGDTQHVYAYMGTYDVTLEITSSSGTVSETKEEYINIISDNQIPAVPRTVRLTCIDSNYQPVPGANVSAVPIGFTAPEGWVTKYYGVTGISFNGTTVYGLTGTDGSWAAPMMAAYLYNFTFTKSGMPTHYMDFYPSSESYLIKLPLTVPTTPINELISYSMYNTTINNTAETFHIVYKDTSGGTSEVTLIVKNTSGTVVYTTSTSVVGTGEVTLSSDAISHEAGDSYEQSLYAVRGGIHINQTRFVTWDRLRTLSMFPDWVSQWFGIILIILLAGIFSAISVKFAVVIIPIFTAFLSIYMKMLDPMVAAGTFLTSLGIITVIGVLKYTREQEKKI